MCRYMPQLSSAAPVTLDMWQEIVRNILIVLDMEAVRTARRTAQSFVCATLAGEVLVS
jgi:hypothetical protein